MAFTDAALLSDGVSEATIAAPPSTLYPSTSLYPSIGLYPSTRSTTTSYGLLGDAVLTAAVGEAALSPGGIATVVLST